MKIKTNRNHDIVTSEVLWGNQHCVSVAVETKFDNPIVEVTSDGPNLSLLFYDDDGNFDSVTLFPSNPLETEILKRKSFVRRSTDQTWIVFISQPMLGV